MPGSAPQNIDGGGLELVINDVYFTQNIAFWTSFRLRQNKFTHIIFVDKKAGGRTQPISPELDPNEFECLELNFKSAPVLPNLYKSDKFIAKALKNDGRVLVVEPAGAHCQKAIAIILGYLMYSLELGFWKAYEALRKSYRCKFELDRFLVMQLYEYEPILEVHRASEEMGHSRAGERLRSVLKRAREASFGENATTATYDCRDSSFTEDLDQEEEEEETNFYLSSSDHNNNFLSVHAAQIDETMIE